MDYIKKETENNISTRLDGSSGAGDGSHVHYIALMELGIHNLKLHTLPYEKQNGSVLLSGAVGEITQSHKKHIMA